MFNEERFAQELGSCLASIDRINDVMNMSDIDSNTDISSVLKSHGECSTYLVKASHYFNMMSEKFKRNYAKILSEFAQKYRKISRGLVMWLLYREDVPVEQTISFLDEMFNSPDVDVGFEDVFQVECSTDIYRDLNMEYDLVFRLSEMTDREMLAQGALRVPNIVENVELLNDIINLRSYSDEEKKFLMGNLMSLAKCVESLQNRIGRKLSND